MIYSETQVGLPDVCGSKLGFRKFIFPEVTSTHPEVQLGHFVVGWGGKPRNPKSEKIAHAQNNDQADLLPISMAT